MDSELIKWLIGIGLTGIGALITSIISWIRTSKMIPKEVKGAELENKQKEASLIEQYDAIVDMAISRAVNSEDRLCKIESKNEKLEKDIESLRRQLNEQEILIKNQSEIIAHQTARLNSQGIRIQEQEELISSLRKDLTAAQEYSNELMAQLKEKNITPKANTRKKSIKPTDNNSE